jgi:hypothetical protein
MKGSHHRTDPCILILLQSLSPPLGQMMQRLSGENAGGDLMPPAGKLGHGSDSHFDFADLEELGLVSFRR